MKHLFWLVILYLLFCSCSASRHTKNKTETHLDSTTQVKADSSRLQIADSSKVSTTDSSAVKKKTVKTEHTTETLLDTAVHLKGDTSDFVLVTPDSKGQVPVKYNIGNIILTLWPTGKEGIYRMQLIDKPRDINLKQKRTETNKSETTESDSGSVQKRDSTGAKALDAKQGSGNTDTHVVADSKTKTSFKEKIGTPAGIVIVCFIVLMIVLFIAHFIKGGKIAWISKLFGNKDKEGAP